MVLKIAYDPSKLEPQNVGPYPLEFVRTNGTVAMKNPCIVVNTAQPDYSPRIDNSAGFFHTIKQGLLLQVQVLVLLQSKSAIDSS
jgi:hypothetical protein